MKYQNIIILFIFSFATFCCKRENINPTDPLKGRLKSIYIDTNGDNSSDSSIKIQLYIEYDSLYRIQTISIFVKSTIYDTSILDGEYKFNFQNNLITIDEIGLDNVFNFHRYKVYVDNNKYITAFNEIDTSTNVEYPFIRCVQANNKIDSFYEKYYWPTAFNRQCYDYHFDGNNYTNFKFEYDWYVIFGGNVHVIDSAKIDYTNLTYTQTAPMQNMYSANTLFNVGAPGEVFYDILYFLGTEGYKFYQPNRNLVNTFRSYHDSTTIVYMDYNFNTNNQLKTFTVNFRTPSHRFFTYDFEYY